jgi:hypothetical protein
MARLEEGEEHQENTKRWLQKEVGPPPPASTNAFHLKSTTGAERLPNSLDLLSRKGRPDGIIAGAAPLGGCVLRHRRRQAWRFSS